MPFIGVQPASALLTSADIQDGQITTAKIANDAVDNTKLDLTSSYDFSAGLTLGDNLTFDVAGKGVHLGVTSATASNLMDDYEEGEWTYTITGSNSGSLSARSGYAKGSYVKIGNLCHVSMRWETDTDNSISGNLYWSLPFTAATPTDNADAWVAPGFVRDNSYGTDARPGAYWLTEGVAYVYYIFSREGEANSTVEVADSNDTDATGGGGGGSTDLLEIMLFT